MYNSFIQYNQQIESFQQVLTLIAIILEVYLGLIVISWLVSSIFEATEEVTTNPQVQISTVPDVSTPVVEPVEASQPTNNSPILETVSSQPTELGGCSVSELRRIAKDVGLAKYSRLSKSNLISQLQVMVPA